MKPSRYLVFGGLETAGPSGGWHDLLGSSNDMSEAIQIGLKGWERNGMDWWFQVIDLDSGKEIGEFEAKGKGDV